MCLIFLLSSLVDQKLLLEARIEQGRSQRKNLKVTKTLARLGGGRGRGVTHIKFITLRYKYFMLFSMVFGLSVVCNRLWIVHVKSLTGWGGIRGG